EMEKRLLVGTRSDVDDGPAAALVFHQPSRRLGAEKSALEIGPDRFVPVFLRKFEQRGPGLASGVVDEAIESAELRHNGDHLLYVAFFSHIALNRAAATAFCFDGAFCFLRSGRITMEIDREVPARFRHAIGDTAPDSFASSGD